MNGSVTPKVIGTRSPGSGSLAMSSSRSFCQKHSPQATTSTASRDDDPVAQLVEVLDERHLLVELCGPQTGRGHLGAVVGYDLALDGLAGLLRTLDLSGLRRLFLVVALARDRGPELADARGPPSVPAPAGASARRSPGR